MAEYQHPSRTMAPRVVINEYDASGYTDKIIHSSPVSVVFGFAPNGPILQNYYFSDAPKFMETFGDAGADELSTAEKYFVNACVNVMNEGGSVIPIRLPYDNDQANTIKYFRYKLSDIYGLSLLINDFSSEHQALKEINYLDQTVSHYRKIEPASIDYNGNYVIEHMSIDDYNDFVVDPYDTGIKNSIYLFDARGEQLRKSDVKDANGNVLEYLGICPVIVTASTALYYQEKLKHGQILDSVFNPLSIPFTSTNTYPVFINKNSIAVDPGTVWKEPLSGIAEENEKAEQMTLRNIFNSFSTTLDFHHQGNYYDKTTVSDKCAETFPIIRYVDKDKLERKYLGAIGVIVLRMVYNAGTEKVDFIIEESFVGNPVAGMQNGLNAISTEINNKSSYIRCALTTYQDTTTDFYHIQNQPLVIMGMREEQCRKVIHYKKSIIEPIQYMFDTALSDVDSLNIDLILDAGLTTIAHYAYHYWKQRDDMTLSVDLANADLTEFNFSSVPDPYNKTSSLTKYNIGTLDEVLRKLAKSLKDAENDSENELIPGNITKKIYFDYNGNQVDLKEILETAANSIYQDTSAQCPVCNGIGTVYGGQICDECGGTGLIGESDGIDDTTEIEHNKFGAFMFDPVKDQSMAYTLNESIIEECSTAWLNIAKLFTSFIESRRGDCFFIMDGPRCLNLVRNYPLATFVKTSNNELFNSYLKYFAGVTSCYAGRYYNWIYGVDISSSKGIWLPPSVLMGAVYTYNDKQKFPWYAPAGFERGIMKNAFDVSIKTKSYGDENDVLYKNNWNFMRQHINTGIVVEGQKTLQTEATALDRINVRRLCNYLKQNIRRISNKYKYEPNTVLLREQYTNDISALLRDVQSNSGISDFYVKCDNSINTNETIDRNELHCQIWFKPIKAVEFIFIDLTVSKQDIGFKETALSTPKYY